MSQISGVENVRNERVSNSLVAAPPVAGSDKDLQVIDLSILLKERERLPLWLLDGLTQGRYTGVKPRA